MKVISVGMVDAVKIQFKKSMCDDDFIEKGMTAWLTDIEWKEEEYYNLYFDFSEFEEINKKYFKRAYYPNKHTKCIEFETGRSLFTALEAKMYEEKYSSCFGISSDKRNDHIFEKEIIEYLKVV